MRPLLRSTELPEALLLERGGTRRLGEVLEALGAKRALVVCGRTVARGEILARVRAGLGARLAGVYDGVLAHTPLQTVLDATALYQERRADAIVSVGGGSATDTGKAVALLVAGSELEPYQLNPPAPRSAERRRLPASTPVHIAVPTVPGAGNVILPTAGILDPATRIKLLFDDEQLVPKRSVLDAELLVHCGRELTAITSVRAIVGAIEALYARRRGAPSDALALESIRLMRASLTRTLQDSADVEAREQALYAAIVGTMATASAGVSAVHAAGLIIGGRYGAAHGIPHAILLPPVMRAFLPVLEPCLPQLAAAFESNPSAVVQEFERLAAQAGLQTRLRAIGVPRDDLGTIAAQTAVLGMMENAPRRVGADEIEGWLEEVW
jgi:alcohol dehydrogenase class IV